MRHVPHGEVEMRFDPKSEKEIAEANLWPASEYDFEVIEAKEETSKAGNDMVHLSVKIYDAEGNFRTLDDYLVGTEKAAFKIRHFAESVGMLSDYESGEIPAEAMIGRAGKCKVIVVKDKSGQYADKNSIGDYLKPKAGNGVAGSFTGAPMKPKAPLTQDLDDEIPFVSCAWDEDLLLRKKPVL
jgi:hypothetical protein